MRACVHARENKETMLLRRSSMSN
uniref:Uncharacterized protein n=1 Tax=Arundo donax TaxID=35708 RepID=A0A0A9SCP1_ARUDO